MIEVQAPATLPKRANVFLAGGIMNADNWQPKALAMLHDTPTVVLNPRRAEPFHGNMQQEQVEWEHHALRRSDAIIFWFPPETLCPITLFELGVWSQSRVPIYVGTHPDYQRRLDVQIQLGLSRPEVFVHDNLEDTVEDFITHQTIRFLKD